MHHLCAQILSVQIKEMQTEIKKVHFFRQISLGRFTSFFLSHFLINKFKFRSSFSVFNFRNCPINTWLMSRWEVNECCYMHKTRSILLKMVQLWFWFCDHLIYNPLTTRTLKLKTMPIMNTLHLCCNWFNLTYLGMPIPWQFSFLGDFGESGNGNLSFLGDRGN